MKIIKYIFSPNHEKYEGVRPINVYLLRLFYFLMFIGVAIEAWQKLATETSWDHTRAVAWCVWAAYPTLAVFGLIKPLRWLPIFVFMIFYRRFGFLLWHTRYGEQERLWALPLKKWLESLLQLLFS